ncbi:FAD-dependent monooxygenase [Phytohabitans rumicis]|uniref:FAD-binding domain-containing protein n=1 Tax=Phytohabitans rumicis TaxID=1076125 RepID=A0A6V8L9E7_9ACTN|nr:FAD-dependent monooxygenase [Phytohabitans rumicis]GFJ91628.1 hypothetical protein Prum_052700 [Phytohabitans rumicis]
MSKVIDGRVIIVGAGPAGLTVAAELALAGVACRVLERRPEPAPRHRLVGLTAGTMAALSLRGCVERFIASGRQVAQLDIASAGTVELGAPTDRFPYLNVMPESEVVEQLTARVVGLGVEVIRGAEVTGLSSDDHGVTVLVRGERREWQERAAYVVGCDGAESAVRDLAGIEFAGQAYGFGALQAEVRLLNPPPGDATIHFGPGIAALSVGWHDGWHRLTCIDSTQPWCERPPTGEELHGLLGRMYGPDTAPGQPRWLGRLRLHERLATRYRQGRVLLAGDAAHLHSPVGGHGINLCLGDGFNLGWKLAAVVRGWAPHGLLDTYEAERRPVAERVIQATDRATALLSPSCADPVGACLAVRDLFGLDTTRPAHATPATAAGPLDGRPVPDAELVQPQGGTLRLRELQRDGRFLLVVLGGDSAPAMHAKAWPDRVRAVVAEAVPSGRLDRLTALLVRPDGYVAWSTRTTRPSVAARLCRAALQRWCGQNPVTATAAAGYAAAGARSAVR